MNDVETLMFRALERITTAMWDLHRTGAVQYKDPVIAARMEDALTFAQSAVAIIKKGDHL